MEESRSLAGQNLSIFRVTGLTEEQEVDLDRLNNQTPGVLFPRHPFVWHQPKKETVPRKTLPPHDSMSCVLKLCCSYVSLFVASAENKH